MDQYREREREINRAAEMSTAYARIVMNNIFLLNGGALVALPAFQRDLKGLFSGGGIVVPIFFIVGLMTGAACSLVTHLQASHYLRNVKANGLNYKSQDDAKNARLVFWVWGFGAFAYLCFFLGSIVLMIRIGSSI
ncbi:MAG: hypothetical protein AAFR17_00615 [Pseudomonadota bacterium]